MHKKSKEGGQMLTINQVREDLKEIRYYYSMQELFDSAANTVKPLALLNKVERYNAVIKTAPKTIHFILSFIKLPHESRARYLPMIPVAIIRPMITKKPPQMALITL